MPENKDLIAYCGLYCGDCFGFQNLGSGMKNTKPGFLDLMVGTTNQH